MQLHDLTPAQLRTLSRQLKERLAYVQQLRKRMEKTNFPKHDRFYRDIGMAETLLHDAVHEIESMRSTKGF